MSIPEPRDYTIEEPEQYDVENEFLPEGLFVIIAWDPVASLASLDEEARAQAALLPRKKYLAVIDGVSTTGVLAVLECPTNQSLPGS